MSEKRLRIASLRCQVIREDIDAMMEAYDSGMCDGTTANAISRAVARLVGLQASQRLVRLNRRSLEIDGGATLEIDGVASFRVPGDAVRKLLAAESGSSREPFEFLLPLPDGMRTALGTAGFGTGQILPLWRQLARSMPPLLS